MTDTVSMALIVAAGTAIASAITFWRDDRKETRALQREARQRDWDVQDRDKKAAEFATESGRLEASNASRTGRVLAAVKENTSITTETRKETAEAFRVANNIKPELIAIHERIDGLKP
jgi:hypothetical protein